MSEMDRLRKKEALADEIIKRLPRAYTAYARWAETGTSSEAEFLDSVDALIREWRTT
jgi:hypothetical protein